MRKHRNYLWLALLVIPMLVLLLGNFFTAKDKERAEASVDAKPAGTEASEEEDPSLAYSQYVVAKENSFYTQSMKEKVLSKGMNDPFEGETFILQSEQIENTTIVERKWDIPHAGLDLMSHLLDFEFSWIVSDEELLLVKTTEKGRLSALLSVNSRDAMIEYEDDEDDKVYQSEIRLTGETYLNNNHQLMIPMEDLLKITGYDITSSGEDLMEISGPENGDEKQNILRYMNENQKQVKEGFFDELEEAQVNKEVNFILLGDLSLGTTLGRKNPFDEQFLEHGGGHFLSYLKEDFDAADMVITNLENVFTERAPHQLGKIYTYKAHRTDYLDVLTEGGITHVNVVNNHMVDFLQEGFDDTLSYLDDYGIDYFGTNLTKTDNIELGNIEVESYSVFEKDGLKVGMLGYLGFNTSYVSDEKILEDIRMMKEVEKVDYIIASMHWGGQDSHEVNWRQKQMGRMLIDNGVDLVYGNHPHVLQEVEIYNGKPIYYSLGNFLFIAYQSAQDPDGVMISVQLEKDGSGEISASFTHTPILWSGDVVKNTYMPKHTEDPAMIRRALDKLKINTTQKMKFN